MNNLKNKCVILGVIILLCLSCLISFVHLEINYIDPDFKEEILPKLNNQNINITTPENKTYNSPMSGYYSATFGFENDKNGNVPVGWTDYSHDGCGTKVISMLDGHKKVLELWDKNNSGYSKIYNNFLPQTSGTIEWWWRQSNGGVASHVIIGDGPTLRWSINNQLQYDDLSGTSHTIILVNPDKWYHHKIVFNCSNNSFDWYIDGVLEADNAEFRYKRSVLSFFRLNTWYSHRDYSFYIDAVGYSWDSNYDIGENTQEGLLLNFTSSVELNWTGYSLDSQDNITIMGNSTIPMPDKGLHTIQVFGNDSLGTIYKSNLRHFSFAFQPMEIITPENITYTEPMAGYYPASYGFENDVIGNHPSNWTISENGGIVEIVAQEKGHKQVVKLCDTSSFDDTSILNSFSGKSYGTIEFYMEASDVSEDFIINLQNSGTKAVEMRFNEDWIEVYDGYHEWTQITNVSDDEWYHIRIDFECSNGDYEELDQYEWRIYIDGIQYGDYDFHNDVSQIDEIKILTGHLSTIDAFVDAIGYSWGSSYNVGDNLNEGLLLSFKAGTTLNWTSYSLDGQNYRTILGNCTIPIPSNGLHTIQVRGTDTLEIIYESNLRYFTINVSTTPNGGGNGDGNIIPIIILIIIGISSVGIVIFIVKLRSVSGKPKKEQIIPEVPLEVQRQEVQKVEITTSFCPMCGTKLSGKEEFCSNCGTEL